MWAWRDVAAGTFTFAAPGEVRPLTHPQRVSNGMPREKRRNRRVFLALDRLEQKLCQYLVVAGCGEAKSVRVGGRVRGEYK